MPEMPTCSQVVAVGEVAERLVRRDEGPGVALRRGRRRTRRRGPRSRCVEGGGVGGVRRRRRSGSISASVVGDVARRPTASGSGPARSAGRASPCSCSSSCCGSASVSSVVLLGVRRQRRRRVAASTTCAGERLRDGVVDRGLEAGQVDHEVGARRSGRPGRGRARRRAARRPGGVSDRTRHPVAAHLLGDELERVERRHDVDASRRRHARRARAARSSTRRRAAARSGDGGDAGWT